jgi:3-isopropylmalate/(R)-2-methylmalate dehydratase large subunit
MTQTLIDKLWDAHEIVRREDGDSLLWVDRHYVHEGSFHAFSRLAERGAAVAEPGLTFGVADHYVPTRAPRDRIENPEIARMVRQMDENAAKHRIRLFGLNDRRQGIVHVVGPEQGLTLPGLLIVCGDSHTSTHGALGIAAKDIVLAIIAKIGADGATGHAIEFAGSAICALSIEGRLTVCNMSIEAGARCGMIAPDAVTFAYLRGRPFVPKGTAFDQAVEAWSKLKTDADATFDREVRLDAAAIAPVVTWGTSPQHALPIDGCVPDPAGETDLARANDLRGAIDYMGLRPGQKLTEVAIDRAFIGSCTNARIEDLRAAAAVLAGRTSKVPGLVSAGSSLVKCQAEEEGLDRIFRDAGLEWGESGCSMCVGINGDIVAPGERCASTTNRNFRGRQGPGARTHLMSPAMVAAAAVAGHLADVRPLLAGRKV